MGVGGLVQTLKLFKLLSLVHPLKYFFLASIRMRLGIRRIQTYLYMVNLK